MDNLLRYIPEERKNEIGETIIDFVNQSKLGDILSVNATEKNRKQTEKNRYLESDD